MFKRAIWDNIYRVHFYEILKSPEKNEGDFKSSKNEPMNEVNFPQISQIKHVIRG